MALKKYYCPKCGKGIPLAGTRVDTFVDCECGNHFYLFSESDLQITSPQHEAKYEPVARRIRKFIVSMKRGLDTPKKLYMSDKECKQYSKRDITVEMDQMLEDFQIEAFGHTILNWEVVYELCQFFDQGCDVILKKKKDQVEILEIKKRQNVYLNVNVPRQIKKQLPEQMVIPGMIPEGILKSPQWSKPDGQVI